MKLRAYEHGTGSRFLAVLWRAPSKDSPRTKEQMESDKKAFIDGASELLDATFIDKHSWKLLVDEDRRDVAFERIGENGHKVEVKVRPGWALLVSEPISTILNNNLEQNLYPPGGDWMDEHDLIFQKWSIGDRGIIWRENYDPFADGVEN